MDKEAFRKHTTDLKKKLDTLKKQAKRGQTATCEQIEDCERVLGLVIEAGGGPIGDQ